MPSAGTAIGRAGRYVAAATPCSTAAVASITGSSRTSTAISAIAAPPAGAAACGKIARPRAIAGGSGTIGRRRSRYHGSSSGTLTAPEGRAVDSSSSHSGQSSPVCCVTSANQLRLSAGDSSPAVSSSRTSYDGCQPAPSTTYDSSSSTATVPPASTTHRHRDGGREPVGFAALAHLRKPAVERGQPFPNGFLLPGDLALARLDGRELVGERVREGGDPGDVGLTGGERPGVGAAGPPGQPVDELPPAGRHRVGVGKLSQLGGERPALLGEVGDDGVRGARVVVRDQVDAEHGSGTTPANPDGVALEPER